ASKAAPTMTQKMALAPRITVPDVTGKTAAAAFEELEAKRFVPGKVTSRDPTWVVKETRPEKGAQVAACTMVSLIMEPPATQTPSAQELVPVPDILGWTDAWAQVELERMGLSYAGSVPEETPSVVAGTYFRQEPTAGSRVARGTAVRRFEAIAPPV